MLFKGASKCKETREEQLFLVWDKGRNALPYLARPNPSSKDGKRNISDSAI